MKIILILVLLILFKGLAYSAPYQLISGENVLIIEHLHFEIKDDIIYDYGYINSWAFKPLIRLGLFNWSEISLAASFNYFPDIAGERDLYMVYYHNYQMTNNMTNYLTLDNPRIAYAELKYKIQTLNFAKVFSMINYFKFKMYNGIPLIVPYNTTTGKDTNAVAVVAADAQGGQEVSAGGLIKFAAGEEKNLMLVLMGGVEINYFFNKQWMNQLDLDKYNKTNTITRDSPYMVVGMFSPFVIFKNKWEFQVENRFEYWLFRGWNYEILPGIRWEVQPSTVIEFGVGIPVLGGNIYRFILGFTYEFGK